MNLLLSDDYLLQDYPENITNTIRSGHSTCLRFNRNGDFLASGRVDGTVVVWDLETMGVARKLRGHSKSITSLSWSRCGRHQFVASIFEDQPFLIDVTDPVDVKHPLPSRPKRPESDGASQKEKWAKEDAKQMTTVTIYTSTGDHILAGTSKGWINIIDSSTLEVIFSRKVCTGIITTLRLTQSGKVLLMNAQDRIIRTLHVPNLAAPDLDPDTIQLPEEHKFQDVVNKLSWNHVTFSATGEYVAASTYNNHELYIWERGHGSLVRMLEGPKEEQGVIEWHPHKALLAACGLETGRINIWSVTSPQKWSALAPDFVEVEENVQYQEKEDEFDIHPQEELTKRRLDLEDENVDVLTVDRLNHDLEESSFRMPVLYNLGESDSEEEFIAVSAGTMRRRSPSEAQGDGDGAEDRASNRKTAAGRGRGRRKAGQ
ncbi:uncharacterized protein E0L32_011218 [Thyridium curvatum]|uniref:Uncharacterized protein n=1 Tax=Thyridium curvatum TaxID=1093900 RepID=A0A507BGG3_9PEZI|nr:uncharacterized protein E0L32_011218 [Thyridium curvatum]TPX19057.1 hypothetical protein E0L32_011218 [Thyridium curvatum]